MYKYQSLQAGQLPWEHLYFLQDLLNFIILKKLKQEAHDDFRVYVYERSSCGLFVIWVTNPNGEVPYGLLSRSWFYYPNLIKVSPVTRDKETCQSHIIMRQWRHYLLRQRTQLNPLNEVYLMSKFDVSSFSMTWDIQIFKLVIFLILSSSKLIVILLNLG